MTRRQLEAGDHVSIYIACLVDQQKKEGRERERFVGSVLLERFGFWLFILAERGEEKISLKDWLFLLALLPC